jgi:hypothetical protein
VSRVALGPLCSLSLDAEQRAAEPPLDAQRPTRRIRARTRVQSAQARPLDAALCCSRHLQLHFTCCHSLCRLPSGLFCVQPCRALRKCGESARPEHWSCHTTGAPRERTLTGKRLHLREHKRARCHPRPPAAPSRQTPPNSRRARAPRVLAAWPAARLVARACCACVLRWRATRVAARPPRGALLPQRRHEPRSRQPIHSRPSPHLVAARCLGSRAAPRRRTRALAGRWVRRLRTARGMAGASRPARGMAGAAPVLASVGEAR